MEHAGLLEEHSIMLSFFPLNQFQGASSKESEEMVLASTATQSEAFVTAEEVESMWLGDPLTLLVCFTRGSTPHASSLKGGSG